ncbi:hypothetical protein F0235_12370 [Vibrio splendidus]|uniref:hypothetical protein n=1 Tax=Vibrio splendidus TaxID=29497 RepID=UPI00148E51C0|nr:hypothetical protein [Vibrio splendidus]NOI91235.1 hypothetical protein [Vibrio splendidus]
MNNILLVCPKFRGYEKVIKNSILKNKIGRVDGFFYDEIKVFNISFFQNFIISILIRFLSIIRTKWAYEFKFKFYTDNSILMDKILIKHDLKDYTHLFIIKGFGLRKKDLDLVKSLGIKVYFYQWDSEFFYPGITQLYDPCDRVFSFEHSKIEKVKFLPNFYVKTQTFSLEKKIQSIFYIGKFSFYRWFVLYKASRKLKRSSTPQLFDVSLLSVKKSLGFLPLVTNVELKLPELKDKYSSSLFCLEFSDAGQHGITQRVFDILENHSYICVLDENEKARLIKFGVAKELIYTVKDIIEQNFPSIEDTQDIFFKQTKINSKYDVDNWITTIFNKDGQ